MAQPHGHVTVVAIPAKNEAERIGPCLRALADQTLVPQSVLLLANDCTDNTVSIAAEMASTLPFALHVECRHFRPEQAHAGQARRVAMALSERMVRPDGMLLTTDADAVAAPDWIERNCRAILSGADAVCGRVELDPQEAALIPAHLHADDALECALIDLMDRIADRLDPDPADPLPRHTQSAGASLAVRATLFRRVGGIPALATGEDRAFVRALARLDAKIRHDPSVVVSVSGRMIGRAAGGMADTIRRRIRQQDVFTDDQIEPAGDSYRRYDFRRRIRFAWQNQSFRPALPIDLGISAEAFAQMLLAPHFGDAWARIEAASPFLIRRRVRFSELPRQIDYANRLLDDFGALDVVRDCDREIR